MVLRVGGDGSGPVYGRRATAPNGLPGSGAARREQAQLVAGRVGDDPPGQLAPVGVELAARPARRPAPRRRPRRRRPRAGGRGAAGSWFRPALGRARGTARAARPRPEGCRRAAGMALETGCQPDSSAQNAASRAGSALSSGSAAIGPDVEYSGRSSMTQNGLPSGSASTTQGTSRWPMSRCRAPRSRARCTTSACREPPLMSRCSRGSGSRGSGTRLEAEVEHQPVGHGEPGLVQVGLVGQCRRRRAAPPRSDPAPGGPARRRRGSRGT